MNSVLIFESDPGHLESLTQMVLNTDPKLNLIHFPHLEAFNQYLKEDAHEKAKERASLDIQLTIIELEPSKESPLRQIRNLLFQNKLATSANPPRFLLTAYKGFVDQESLKDPFIMNLIYKPFDSLTAREFIRFAIQGFVKPDTQVFEQASHRSVELLKKVKIRVLTELGFKTSAKRRISEHQVAKYYGPPFQGDQTDSVYAYCYSSTKVSEFEYRCSFSFFGISRHQLMAIRRRIQKTTDRDRLILESTPFQASKVFVISQNEDILVSIKSIISEAFKHVTVETHGNIDKWLESETATQLDAIFLDKKNTNKSSILELKEKFKGQGTKFFLVSESPIKTYEELQLAAIVDDYYCFEFDRFFFKRRMKNLFHHWETTEELARDGIKQESFIHAAMAVELEVISESHIVAKYHRQLKTGDRRNFVFDIPGEINAPEVAAICYHSEPSGDKEYKAWFVFFGIRDDVKKYIRRWIRREHIMEKQ